MKTDRRPRIAVVLGILLVSLTLPAIVSAQSTGAIAGVVRDATGAVLPGVTVEAASPALIEKVRVVTTDESGNYRIVELRPGVYTVTFTLTGFSNVRREGIEISAGFTAPVNADLRIGAVEETITVTGASPVVDVQTARTQQVLKADVLDALPSAMKDLTALVNFTLGATTSTLRNDVGGDKGELSTGISIHGSRGDDSRTNYDGMSTNNFYGGGGGQQRTYKFNTVGVQETVIDTGGSTVETETGGANINMVPKDGGNRFSLHVPISFTNEHLSSGKVPQSLIDRGSAPDQDTMKTVYDYGVGVGGPIVRDRLWFYSANRVWGNQGYAANNYFNRSTVWYRYEPDQSRPAYSDQYYKDFGGRVTWQASAKHKVTFSENVQTSCACWMGIGGTTAPEAMLSYLYGDADNPELLTQVGWTFPATNRLLFQAGISHLKQAVSFQSRGGPDIPDARRVTDQGLGYSWGFISPAVITDLNEPQNQANFNYRFSASYITGSHSWRVGVQGLRGRYDTRGNPPPGGVTYTFTNGTPTSLTQWASPFKSDARIRSLGIYASDQWTINRLTLGYGVRYDHFNAYTLDITNPAGPFIGERFYEGIEDVPNFSDITPRVSASYDLSGTGKTAIKASWGRYLLGWGGGAFNFVSPANSVITNGTRLWNDQLFGPGDPRSGNYVPDCDLNNRGTNGECAGVTPVNFGSPVSALTWDERSRTGWGVRDYNEQVSVTLQHELRPGFGLNIGYYRTSWGNPHVLANAAVTPADFDPYCVTAPVDPRLGDTSGRQVCGLYDLTFAGRLKGTRSVWMRTEDVEGVTGERTDVYNGVDIGMNWRFSQGGLLMGGVAIGRSVTDDCYANDFPNITSNIITLVPTAVGNRDDDYCRVASPIWSGIGSQVKLQVVYPLPYDFQISGSYKNLPGIPLLATVIVPNSAIAPSLGRNLSACPAPTGPCPTGTASVNVMPAQTEFDDRLSQLDLRLSRLFRVGAGRIQGVFEVYNAFNGRPSQANQTTYNATYLRPQLILGGRLFKFGAQVDF